MNNKTWVRLAIFGLALTMGGAGTRGGIRAVGIGTTNDHADGGSSSAGNPAMTVAGVNGGSHPIFGSEGATNS